jgi:DNA mismatch repair protein MutL
MGAIRVLPPEIVNRIAAGEVVERPASVLKELVENSIDASATEIAIELEAGGTHLMRVRDNGTGMLPEDLLLAFKSHATSKLTDEQLQANFLGIGSLGFRGEALASVSSVAKVEMTSRHRRSEHAWRYCPGAGEPEPAAGEEGTTVEVRDLFYNVPARRKFLRSQSTELAQSIQQFTRLAVAFPGIRFRLAHGGKRVFDLPATDSLKGRLEQILGREAVSSFLEVRSSSPGPPSLAGFLGGPRLHRKDSRGQHFFVNGRWVRDRLMSHALRAAYQGFLISGNQPVAYLFLEVPPEDLDVNVHPTKTEVRFRDSSSVYSLIHATIRGCLEAGGPRGAPSAAEETAGLPAGDRRERLEEAVKDFLARPDRERRFFPVADPRFPSAEARPLADRPPTGAATLVEFEDAPPSAFQVLRSYIVVDAPDGLVIIDQHAFHEKIIFEEILGKLQAGKMESQRLFVPEVVDLPPELIPLIEPAGELLSPLGFELSRFGPGAAAVHALPAILDREMGPLDLAGMVRSVLEGMLEGAAEPAAGGEPSVPGASLGAGAPPPVSGALRRLAATLACKRAVKAGTPLGEAEIRGLLGRGSLAEDPRHCPHGRPTAIFLSRPDIERQFDRK